MQELRSYEVLKLRTNSVETLHIKPHTADRLLRLDLGQFVTVNIDAAFFDLYDIRLDCALVQVLQKREEAALELDV